MESAAFYVMCSMIHENLLKFPNEENPLQTATGSKHSSFFFAFQAIYFFE